MSAFTLLAGLLIASNGPCYLVTNDRIETIPCRFDAAATDALRYAARDAAKDRAKTEPQRSAFVPSASTSSMAGTRTGPRVWARRAQ